MMQVTLFLNQPAESPGSIHETKKIQTFQDKTEIPKTSSQQHRDPAQPCRKLLPGRGDGSCTYLLPASSETGS